MEMAEGPTYVFSDPTLLVLQFQTR